MCQHVSLVRRLLPPKRLTRLLFYLLNAQTSSSPGRGKREKACDYFLFIPFHSSQPAIASFSPLLKRLFNMWPEIYLFSFQFRCSLHLNFFEDMRGGRVVHERGLDRAL